MAYIKIVIEEILELELIQLLQDITIIILSTINFIKRNFQNFKLFILPCLQLQKFSIKIITQFNTHNFNS